MARPNREILTGGKRYKEKKLKNRVQEVVFDKDKRKDYLTGFHKRKLERKKKAQEYLEEEAKKHRLEERASIREERKLEVQRKLVEMKEAMSLNPFLDNITDTEDEEEEDDGDEEDGEKREVKFSENLEESEEEWNGFDKEEGDEESKTKKSKRSTGILKKQIYEIDNEDAPVTGTSEVVIEALDNPNKADLSLLTAKMNVDMTKAEEVLDGSITRAKKYARLMGMSDSPEETTTKVSKPKKKKFRYLSKSERKVNNMKIKHKAYKKRNKDREEK